MTLPTLSFRAQAPAGTLGVSLEQLMVGGLLLQAASGGGKSRAIRQLLEETHGRVQHLVIDPEGEFASLRERFDYVHAAPSGADVVATPKTARLLCRRLVESGASAVLDIYDLKVVGHVDEKREFVRLFLEELMALPRGLWKPVLVVVDEADFFAPQQGESVATDAILDVNGRGRKRGYRLVLTTRRLSKLHKDAADLQNRMIGLTGLDLDVKRAGDELGFDKESRAQLTRLDPGQFFVYGPAIARTPVLARSGAVTTTHPEPGTVGKAAPPAPAKVRALIAQLADLPKEAEAEARSLEDLRKENAVLKRQLKTTERTGVERVVEKVVVDERAIVRAVQAAVAPWERRHKRLTAVLGNVFDAAAAVVDRVKAGQAIGAEVISEPERTGGAQAVSPSAVGPSVRAVGQSSRAPARPIATGAPAPLAGDVAPGEQRILDALAELEAFGIAPASRDQVGIFAGYNLSGGTPGKYVGRLVAQQLVAVPGTGELALTDAGRAAARLPEVALTRAELHRRALDRLGDGERKILQHLIEIHPTAQTRAEVGAAVGYNLSGGTPGKYVGKLVTLRFVDIPGTGQLKAGKLLYPEGL